MTPPGTRTLVTCGLPYANGPLHLGHLRTYIPGDIYVRTLRHMGETPVFVCGSDTHGTPIVVNAEEQKTTPKALVERYHKHFQETFRTLGVSFDVFGSTDDPLNHQVTQEIVRALQKNGHIYPKTVEMAYCPKCKRFLPDRYVEGTCPHCGARARGDECDQGCRRHLEPGEVKKPKCRVCGSAATTKPQEHYFFRLSSFQKFLLDYLEGLDGTPNARNYAREWAAGELRDWCITRNMEWGVKFPGSDLVVYVWVDAPIGYISFTPEWERVWKDGASSRIVHFIGADIVYHHCVFWPALLKGAGLALPSAVVASGMLTIDGNKFSKSRGYVVYVEEDYLKQGLHPDLLRYYIAATTSQTRELDFSWRLFQEKVNNELVAILGNFLYRILSFAWKNFGRFPPGEIERTVSNRIADTRRNLLDGHRQYEFKKMADAAMGLATFGNNYFQSKEPWHLVKEDRNEAGEVVKNGLQLAKALAIFFEPFLPRKMEEAWAQLRLPGDIHTIPFTEAEEEVPTGRPLGIPSPLFAKMEDHQMEKVEDILRERLAEAQAKSAEE